MESVDEHRLTSIEDKVDSNTNRINELEKRQDDLEELVSTVKVLAVREENVENDVKEIKSDVKSLASKPGKRWDSLIDKIIITIAAAILGFILARLGFQ